MAVAHPHCDQANASAAKSSTAPEHPRLVLAATILASSLAFVDGSVVNVGLPAIGRSLDASTPSLPWLVNAYLLPLSALLLVGGAAGDRYGRRRLLVAGTALFALASVLCAAAPTLSLMLIGRFVQGLGAALLMPNSLAMLGQTFSGEAKGKAIGIWAATGAIAGAVGPVLGGWLIDLGSWRAIFLLNLPLAAGAILLALRFAPRDAANDGPPLDIVGGVLATLSLAALTWGLTVGSAADGWTATTILAVAGGLAGLGLFVAVEQRKGERAMMPLSLFASNSFIGLTLLTLLLYGALGGLLVLIPYVLIEVAGYSATMAGAALLPLPLVLAITSPFIGSLAGRIGARLPLTIGPVIVALGFLLALRIDATGAYWTQVLPAILVIALGLSGAVAPLTTAVLSAVDARHTGSASGFNSAIARTGGLIATALLGAVLAVKGAQQVGAFHGAMIACAIACLLAGLSALFLLAPGSHAAVGTTTSS